jgi:hypothetical protein
MNDNQVGVVIICSAIMAAALVAYWDGVARKVEQQPSRLPRPSSAFSMDRAGRGLDHFMSFPSAIRG